MMQHTSPWMAVREINALDLIDAIYTLMERRFLNHKIKNSVE